MRIFILIAIVFLLSGCKNENTSSIAKDNLVGFEKDLAINNQDLIIVDQDYNKALKIAALEDKSIFIDFYTTWCAPCKTLDKLVFQNDSIKKILRTDFILLKYNAENDTVFHLSKKHHVSSYPTGLVLNKKGYVLNRKYGFRGNDFKSLSKSVLEFTNESIEFNKENKILVGYSNKIDVSKYPKFYTEYINRTNTKKNPTKINEYLNTKKDVLSEEYFSTLFYFAKEASDKIADKTLNNKEKYLELYGKTDSDILFYFLTSGKFKRAILEKSQIKYNEAVVFAKNSLSKEWTDDILPSYEIDLLKAKNKWDKVFEINKNLKNNGEFDNDYVNHFSWQVYKDCDDQKVIKKCIDWMKEVIDEEPTYLYLDTYAHLMYKSGNKEEAKNIALLALEAGKKEDERTASIEKLINKL